MTGVWCEHEARDDYCLFAQAADPIQRGPGCFDATTKLAIGEVVILFSFLAFAQSIRMMNHLVRLF